MPRCFAHADAEALDGDPGLDNLERRPVAHEPRGTGASFMNASQPPLDKSSSVLSISS